LHIFAETEEAQPKIENLIPIIGKMKNQGKIMVKRENIRKNLGY
jgi:hypothetical protein